MPFPQRFSAKIFTEKKILELSRHAQPDEVFDPPAAAEILAEADPVRVEKIKPEIPASPAFDKDVSVREVAVQDAAVVTEGKMGSQRSKERLKLGWRQAAEKAPDFIGRFDFFGQKKAAPDRPSLSSLQKGHRRSRAQSSFF
jgi:hypothetical protein